MAWSGFRNKKDGPQQGTLFDVREVPSQPVDSPGMQKRGRREEMVAAMPNTKVFESDPRHTEVRQKIVERGAVAEMYPGNPQVAEKNTATDRAGRGRRAEMGRELADRTTVDPDTLRGIHQISEGQYDSAVHPGQRRPSFSASAAAHYDAHSNVNGPVIEAPYKMNLGTLTHEIGHHESLYHQRNTQTGEARATLRRGGSVGLAEEGRADAFALKHAPKDRDYTYASNAQSTDDEATFTAPESEYRRAREGAGEPLRPWEGGTSLSTKQFSAQTPLFNTERAVSNESEAEVDAFTRDGGKDVIGWSPIPIRDDPQSIQKHEYPTYEQTQSGNHPYYGANYVSRYKEDLYPDSLRNEWGSITGQAKQTWKQR